MSRLTKKAGAVQQRCERYAGRSATLFSRLDQDDQRELLRIVRELTRMLDELS